MADAREGRGALSLRRSLSLTPHQSARRGMPGYRCSAVAFTMKPLLGTYLEAANVKFSLSPCTPPYRLTFQATSALRRHTCAESGAATRKVNSFHTARGLGLR